MGELIAGFAGIASAFGLATSAGLNAYIPLLVVAVLGRVSTEAGWNLIHLREPWDTLTSWWIIGLLVVLLIIEMTVDKIPAVDTVNDVINTVVRPSAGAILFAANASVVTDIHPVLALACGVLLAGGVHAIKATARPIVTTTTAGVGNPIVSVAEDIVAGIISILSVVIPILMACILIIIITTSIWLTWRRRSRRRATNA
ncbi:MAG: DUF4126 domain-containing protein [Anaerolineales bacterium]|nr:DUF4126 domain-containing protein [Anaerolineales bacterium]